MAVPEGGVTRWFRDSNGRISQINGILEITFGSPLVGTGYYRDSPPVVVGGAAALGSTVPQEILVVAGGSTQTIGGGLTESIVAPSSVVEDDAFTHVPLRAIFFPVPIVFFRTVDDLTPTNPDTNTFEIESPLDRSVPKDTFDTFNLDCCFAWGEDCAIWNVAPPGWSVGDS